MDLNALKAALEASPENVPLLLLIAQEHLDRFDLDEADSYLKKATQLQPGHAKVQLLAARLSSLQGHISEAIVRLEALCQKFPEMAEAWLFLASLTVSEGDGPLARGYYEKAVAIDPNLKNDKLLTDIIQAGGASSTRKSGHSEPATNKSLSNGNTESGPFFEGDHFEDDGIPSLDGVLARELEVDFQLRSDRKFEDVGGMSMVKDEIRMKIIHPLKNPKLFEQYGKKIGGGVLLYGPPGCGKTLMSLATGGEIQSTFLSVGLHQILNMYIGESESRLHDIFQLARRHNPCVLFFDEIDALAADRRDMRQSAGRHLINQFLSELDGAGAHNDGILVLGATNAPWHVDNAFLRPGRFDRIIFVPPPDLEARIEIAQICSREKPVIEFSAEEFARKTEGFSGADIRSAFDRATEEALQEALQRGGQIVPITGKKLLKAVKNVRPSTRKWFESARNYALYANQDGLYDDILKYLKMNHS